MKLYYCWEVLIHKLPDCAQDVFLVEHFWLDVEAAQGINQTFALENHGIPLTRASQNKRKITMPINKNLS